MTLPRLSRFSVRLRITFVVALLTAIALIGVGFTLYAMQRQNVHRSIDSEQTKEISEFRDLQSAGMDPETGKPFADANRLLKWFLVHNLPAPGELFYGFPTSGQPFFQGKRDRALESAPAFISAVEQMRFGGGRQEINVGGDTYRLSSQPVHDDDGDAVFVVVHNLTKANAEVNRLLTTYAIVASLSWLIITCVASLMAGRLLMPVRRLRETAQVIYGGDLTRRIEVTGNDDLTELQRTFNEMLDRLESAFATQRQLLDNAGHELRTPLTILRGHLELLDVADPAETEATRVLLLDELDRMSRLVNDLLMLAKIRRPDFVTLRDTDVGDLAAEWLNKARAMGRRDWQLDAQATGMLAVDRQRLTQAVMQLVENAIRHTTDADQILIGSRRFDDRLEFWVHDSGEGVAPQERERIFERFHRGLNDEGGQEGFGLGLSIVAAIAGAHGGKVQLDQTDTGATFRLIIPSSTREGLPV